MVLNNSENRALQVFDALGDPVTEKIAMIIPNITTGGMGANLLLLDNGNLAVVVDTKSDDDGSFAIDVYHQNWIIYRPLSLQTKN